MTKSVTIRDVTYDSMSEAAAALGVSINAVSSASKRGTLDNVGLGSRQPGCAASYTKSTEIAGVTFPSRTAAAEALGVSLSALSLYFTVLDAAHNYAASISEENENV